MKYYKVVYGYDAEDYIQIDETELKKAIFAHMTGKNAAFSGGTITGGRIVAIQPDYHRAMGWNRGHKLGPLDYEELSEKKIDRQHMTFLADAKTEVQMLGQGAVNKPNLLS